MLMDTVGRNFDAVKYSGPRLRQTSSKLHNKSIIDYVGGHKIDLNFNSNLKISKMCAEQDQSGCKIKQKTIKKNSKLFFSKIIKY